MGTCASVAASDCDEGLVVDACNVQGVKSGGDAVNNLLNTRGRHQDAFLRAGPRAVPKAPSLSGTNSQQVSNRGFFCHFVDVDMLRC